MLVRFSDANSIAMELRQFRKVAGASLDFDDLKIVVAAQHPWSPMVADKLEIEISAHDLDLGARLARAVAAFNAAMAETADPHREAAE